MGSSWSTMSHSKLRKGDVNVTWISLFSLHIQSGTPAYGMGLCTFMVGLPSSVKPSGKNYLTDISKDVLVLSIVCYLPDIIKNDI